MCFHHIITFIGSSLGASRAIVVTFLAYAAFRRGGGHDNVNENYAYRENWASDQWKAFGLRQRSRQVTGVAHPTTRNKENRRLRALGAVPFAAIKV